jgi:DNA polymerase-1
MEKTLILIDGSSFIFRAFYAIPNLKSPSNMPTGAIYGVVNMLKQMLKKYETNYWCCVFDAKGKTFRDELYSEYKANRRETPEDLIPQFEYIFTIVKSLGIPIIIHEGVEADDIIGSMAIKALDYNFKVLIATGDKDIAQLVNDKITLINTMTDEILDYQGVIDKFGVKPEQIVDYLTLVGDKVDNVKGVDKCGPKTAVKWLNEFSNLDNIVRNCGSFGGVVGNNLRNSLNWLPIAKKLITIRTDINLEDYLLNGINSLKLSTIDQKNLLNLYSKLGFKSWLKELEANASDEKDIDFIANKESMVIYLHNNKDIDLLHKEIIKDKTQNIYLHIIPSNSHDELLIIKFLFIKFNQKIYVIENYKIRTNHDDLFADINLPAIEYNNQIKLIFASDNPKILTNYKNTLDICYKLQININNVKADLVLLHYIYNSKEKHGINEIYNSLLNINVIALDYDNLKNDKNYIQNLNNNVPSIIEQHIVIMNYIDNIYDKLWNKLSQKEQNLYNYIELPLTVILIEMENSGIMIDVIKFKQIEINLNNKLLNLTNLIYQYSNVVFNINSPKQLQDVLFNQLKLPVVSLKKNSTGGYSTDEDSLNILKNSGYKIAELLLEYRTISKLLNTYITKLPVLVDKKNRIHTTFEQTIVSSGRLSSREPNLQNIPIKNNYGKLIRSCFVAAPDHVFICVDYSQIELRILANFCEDENLISAFNNNLDIHSITASEIFNKNINDITVDERRYAKTINFSLLYGKTIFGLAKELNIERETAKLYIEKYFAKYPNILVYLENIKKMVHENGYVETMWGRKIYFSNINSNNKLVREAEERAALNSPMQGTSADIIKIAMINIDKWIKYNNLSSKMVLQIHDELIIEAPMHEIKLFEENLAQLMVKGFNLKVKLDVDMRISNNWDDGAI